MIKGVSCSSTWSITSTFSFLLLVVWKHRLGEDTLTIKSVRMSVLDCQSNVNNDVLDSWNLCYLYYLNEPLLVAGLRGWFVIMIVLNNS